MSKSNHSRSFATEMSDRTLGSESSKCACDKQIKAVVVPIVDGVRKAVVEPVITGSKAAIEPTLVYIYKDFNKPISTAGNYALAENYDNILEIVSTNVNLNLNGFVSNLLIKSSNNIKITNGVLNSLSIQKSDNIYASAIKMYGPVNIKNSTDVMINKITFNGTEQAIAASKVRSLTVNNSTFSKCVNCLVLQNIETFTCEEMTVVDPTENYGNISCTNCNDFSLTYAHGIGNVTLELVDKLVISGVKSNLFQLKVNRCSAGLVEEIITNNMKSDWITINNSTTILVLSSTLQCDSYSKVSAVTFDETCSNCCCKELIIDGAHVGIKMKGVDNCNQAYNNKISNCNYGVVCKRKHRNVILGNHVLFAKVDGFVGVHCLKAHVNKLGGNGVDYYTNLNVICDE